MFFCLPILVLGCAMEFALRQIPNAYQVKSDYLEAHQNSIKTLLLGSSHILYGVNPEYLTEDALNYGHVSQTIDIDCDILHRYINNLEALETVVLRLSYTTLFEQLKHGDERWRIKDYELYTDINLDATLKQHFEMFTVKLKYNLERMYTYYILSENLEYITAQGWSENIKHELTETIEEQGAAIAERHTINNDELYVENFKTLESIIQVCNEKGIRVILVSMPAYRSYVESLNHIQLERTIAVGEIMDLKYNNCIYFNYMDDKRFGRQDFLDADHLNRLGAEKFSKVLDSILIQ